MTKDHFYEFLADGMTVVSRAAAGIKTIYAPLCGTDSSKVKSAITPFLAGDIKIDKYRYLTKPVSTEDLRHGARNFYLYFGHNDFISLAEPQTGAKSEVNLGFLWHKVTHQYTEKGMAVEVLNFVPTSGQDVEVMRITVTNTGKSVLRCTPTGVVPLFGRSLANKHDHEHVTSLLNRAQQVKFGVTMQPTMRFNEEGHKPSNTVYFVLGCDGSGNAPQGTFPTMQSFCGDSGTLERPDAVLKNLAPCALSDVELQGREVVGALRFKLLELAPGARMTYLMITGIVNKSEDLYKIFASFSDDERVLISLKETEKYWQAKVGTLVFDTASMDFNAWMKWVTLQPVLRRIFGCSFLPDHDYGKGGKGWRDLWQDLLSLILIEPENVRENLINNYSGIRFDGTNATIIGSGPGEFIADRNAITRVWMDHGVWPFLTTQLYIDQTGDYDLLFEKAQYFRDPQQSRTFEKDLAWTPEYGQWLKSKMGEVYQGTILEHVLVQNLVQFFNVGEHNITRLESADWNDGLDMAFKRGESVAFMAFYAGNLYHIAGLLARLAEVKKLREIEVAEELAILMDTLDSQAGEIDYNSPAAKQELLFKRYFPAVQPELSGKTVKLNLREVVMDLRRKAEWIAQHIRLHEKVSVKKDGDKYFWFNGYYDNQGKRVEGIYNEQERVRMTLTGQVFPLMSGIAEEADIAEVVKSVKTFLQDKELGGFRLNSDFGISHYLDMGRAFGFAYGTKENGAFFSHMTVMYAYALYSRGFVNEGFEVLDSIYKMAISPKAKIYPGVPEYFDSTGKGMYHFLTGSASWYVLTVLTQVFGVRGCGGDLLLDPKLKPEQFDKDGRAAVTCQFAGKQLTVIYLNVKKLAYGHCRITDLKVGDIKLKAVGNADGHVVVPREILAAQPTAITLTAILE